MCDGKRRHHPEKGPHGYERGQEHPHSHRGEGGRRGSHGRGGPGGGRIRRGEARYILLDTLRDGPKHGYEIIKTLEERSSGQYTASPGTVYPTLQFLEDLGLVRAIQEAERRVYQLTEAGRTELDAHAEAIRAFWAQFAVAPKSAAHQAEIGFLQEEMESLTRTVWGGLRDTVNYDDTETVRRVRQAVEQCRNVIRNLMTEPNLGEKENTR